MMPAAWQACLCSRGGRQGCRSSSQQHVLQRALSSHASGVLAAGQQQRAGELLWTAMWGGLDETWMGLLMRCPGIC